MLDPERRAPALSILPAESSLEKAEAASLNQFSPAQMSKVRRATPSPTRRISAAVMNALGRLGAAMDFN
ncbi:MAG: hypothetical protein R2714_13325 [Microthrixaceae bacterium]